MPFDKTALTPPKSMPLSATWALAPFLSSWVIVTLRTPNEVRMCRRMNRMTHQVSETRTRVLLKAAAPQLDEILFMESIERSNECSDTAIGPAAERALASSSAKVEERRRVVDRTIRNREKEDAYPASGSAAFTSPAPVSVSRLIPHTCAANLCFGKMPHMACLECSDECSAIVEGPAVKLALTYSSSEAGERLRATVYIQYEAEESIYAPTCSAAATLPVSMPAVPSARSTHLQPSDGLTSHTEVMSERHDLNVASKMPEMHLIHSQNLEAAQRQSNPSSTLARVDGGGPLAKADAHIQECSRRCSPASSLLDSAPPSSPATFDPPPLLPSVSSAIFWCQSPLHVIAPAGLCVRRFLMAMGRKRPSSPPPSIMNTSGLDSWVGLQTDLPPHDKATVAIDAITNELPERSALPFEFFELAILALQKSTDDARAAVQQRNKTINELRTLCSNLKAHLAALSAAPALHPSPSATASTSASVAMRSMESLHKPPKVSFFFFF